MGRSLRLCLFFTLGVFASQVAAEDERLKELAHRIDRPRLGAVVEDSGPIPVGRGVIIPASPVRVLLCGEEPCGLFVAGAAGFTYRVEDRFSVPVAQRNFRTSSSFKPEATSTGLKVSTRLKGAVVWGWGLATGLRSRPGSEPSELPEWIGGLLDRSFFDDPCFPLILERRLPGTGVRYALLHGVDSDLWLLVDPVKDRSETLHRLKATTKGVSVRNAGRHHAIELAAQPIDREWWQQEIAPLVAVHRDLVVDQDGKRHATVTSTTRIEGQQGRMDLWWARLFNARSNGEKTFSLKVRSVEVNGKPADYHFWGGLLMVALEPALGKGQQAEVKVVQEGEFALRKDGHKYWSLGTWPWYPTADRNAELATMDLTVRVPSDLEVIASGTTLSREEEGGFTVLRTRLEKPMRWPVVAVGKYDVFRDRRLNIDASVATYFGKDERGAKRLLNNFFAAVQCFQRYFDVPYPFKEVEVVELAEWGRGQAPPGVIFITQEAVSTFLDAQDRFFSDGVNARYLHEVAHGWWPHVAKTDSPEENWTSESFAEYTSAVCLDALSEGNDSFRMKSSLARWRGEMKGLGDGGSLFLAEHLSGDHPKNREARRDLLYAKGPLVLHALRQELKRQNGAEVGEKQFWILLRSYLKSFSYTWGGTSYLVAILDKITGQSWQPWFELYVYGTQMPPFKR